MFCRHIRRPALLVFVVFYGIAVYLRNLLFDVGILPSKSFELRVISVGNITVGGTGKTPHVEYLIKLLNKKRLTAVLSRGYKRKTRNFILASLQSTAEEIGDEPLQIKKKFPDAILAVEASRSKGITQLEKLNPKPDLVILDDAFQHRYIRPGLSIVLIDYSQPVFEDCLLPAGNLRESQSALKRADILVVSKCPADLNASQKKVFIDKIHLSPHQHLFFSKLDYGTPLPVFPAEAVNKVPPLSIMPPEKKTGVLVVTAIANPQPLYEYLANHWKVCQQISYPDHHVFTSRDLKFMNDAFDGIEAEYKWIITTEKDAVRFREADIRYESLASSLYYLPVEVMFADSDGKTFDELVLNYVDN